ncbi:MAG: 2-hydroxyacyl-CoA dehydratase family protein [Myxococcota bacterium]|jgi:benzoyl-CoA reductase/2-hydroxyglutaryl-CoA dehydratase subunit BcrC/BadD/HgdB
MDLDRLLQNPLNGYIEKAVEDGAIPVGYTCSAVPETLLSVGPLIPVRVTAPGIAGTENADSYMSSVTCSYVRSLLEYALDGRYDFLRGWVFAASCDHLRRLYDNVSYLIRPAFCHIIDTPHSGGPAAIAWMREELGILRNSIASHFGVRAGDDELSAAIAGFNRNIALLKKIGDSRKLESPPLSGGQFHRLMIAASVLPPDAVYDLASGIADRLENRQGIKGRRARIMVTGGRIDDAEFIDAIESQGALVVADRFCTGSMPALTLINGNIDPLSAITEHTFARTDCPRIMGDFPGRVMRVIEGAREYRADGVIVQATKFCDMWGVEAGALVGALREAHIPVLRLEHEYRLGAEGQLKTRVQAFMESMGR